MRVADERAMNDLAAIKRLLQIVVVMVLAVAIFGGGYAYLHHEQVQTQRLDDQATSYGP
jgi:hypothetical protein